LEEPQFGNSIEWWFLLRVSEISDETSEHELEESQNVQIHRWRKKRQRIS
jgi:hypothetical protein